MKECVCLSYMAALGQGVLKSWSERQGVNVYRLPCPTQNTGLHHASQPALVSASQQKTGLWNTQAGNTQVVRRIQQIYIKIQNILCWHIDWAQETHKQGLVVKTIYFTYWYLLIPNEEDWSCKISWLIGILSSKWKWLWKAQFLGHSPGTLENWISFKDV